MGQGVELMDYSVFSGDLEEISWDKQKPLIINTINAYSYIVARGDREFKSALQDADILVPDGFPVVVAAKFLKKREIQKIAGADVFMSLCKKMNRESGSCFFLGSSESTLSKIKERFSRDYPQVKSAYYSPPFKEIFSDDDNQNMIQAINAFKPEVLFVGMTAPKQEKWVAANSESIQAGVITSIGAVFDFYAGTTARPSAFWVNNNLEWFIRLIKEPKRLWKRYMIYSPLFFIHMLRYKFFRK